MVKAYVCKAAEWVTREAMQIHGGMGYAEEFAVSRLFVDARVLSIFEGADEVLCLKVIARRLSRRLNIAIRSASDLIRSKSASGWSSYGSSSSGCRPAARGTTDVHLHRVADVGDAIALELGEVGEGVVEDPRVGLGDADDVAVDHAPHDDPDRRRRPGRPAAEQLAARSARWRC